MTRMFFLLFFFIEFEFYGSRSSLQLCKNVTQTRSVDYAFCDTEIRVYTLCAGRPKT